MHRQPIFWKSLKWQYYIDFFLRGIFLFYINLFIYLWLHWVFIAVRSLSLAAVSGGYSSLRCVGFSLWWLLLLRSMGSRRAGFSSYGMRVQYLWHTGLVAPQHVGSSWTRAQTHVPCFTRQILNHCVTSGVPMWNFLRSLILKAFVKYKDLQ